MQELNRHVEDHTQILFGTSVDSKMGNRMSVTLISSLSAEISEPNILPMRPAPQIAVAEPVVEAAPPTMPIVPEIVTPSLPEPAFESVPNEHNTDWQETVEQVAEIIPLPVPEPPKRKPAPARAPEVKSEPAEAEAQKPPAKKKIVQARQEVMQFEPVTRGRFEKSEPTIVEGQDLDVPTYLRKNIRVK